MITLTQARGGIAAGYEDMYSKRKYVRKSKLGEARMVKGGLSNVLSAKCANGQHGNTCTKATCPCDCHKATK